MSDLISIEIVKRVNLQVAGQIVELTEDKMTIKEAAEALRNLPDDEFNKLMESWGFIRKKQTANSIWEDSEEVKWLKKERSRLLNQIEELEEELLSLEEEIASSNWRIL